MPADVVTFFRDTQLMWGLIGIGLSLFCGLSILGKPTKSKIFIEKKSEKIFKEILKNLDDKDTAIFISALSGIKPEKISKESNIEQNVTEQNVGKILRACLKGKQYLKEFESQTQQSHKTTTNKL